jgi:RNA polymerase sigma factor for flagellar operon FliA
VNSATATTSASRMLPADLWQHYRNSGDPGARRQLLELYMGLVHHVAREMSRRTSAVELDDLVSAGTFGLIRALDSFDLSRGLAFSTYAVRRIRGAILDDLRSQDWAPRAVRVKARRLQVATVALEARLGRPPRPEEVAEQLDIDITTYWRWRDDTATRTVVSFEGVPRSSGGTTSLQELVEDGESSTPHEGLGRQEDVKLLREAIGRLPEKERTVMALYYYEELNQRQIAEVMHVTESRVSQIRAQALKRLRSRLAPAGGSR